VDATLVFEAPVVRQARLVRLALETLVCVGVVLLLDGLATFVALATDGKIRLLSRLLALALAVLVQGRLVLAALDAAVLESDRPAVLHIGLAAKYGRYIICDAQASNTSSPTTRNHAPPPFPPSPPLSSLPPLPLPLAGWAELDGRVVGEECVVGEGDGRGILKRTSDRFTSISMLSVCMSVCVRERERRFERDF